MTRSDISPAGVAELVELDRNECLSLLAQGGVGRVVFTESAMPAAHPVNYLLDGEDILFRTGDGRAFAAIRGAVVGFQADAIDTATRTGWSVLVVGLAREVTEPARLATLTALLPEAWAPQRSSRVVVVPAQRVTGRRIGHRPAP